MTVKINQRIKGFKVVDETLERSAATTASDKASKVNVVEMDESLQRPETLIGMTYKIKSPLFEHALYVTVNDIVLNAGTPHEQRRPFEVFINSKNMDHFQWIVALTRIMSAVFRKGGDVTFLVDEMKAVFDPRGGYFKAGGVYMPSIVAEIGSVVEEHLKSIGMIIDPELGEEQKRLIAEKRAAYEAKAKKKSGEAAAPAGTGTEGAARADEAVQVTGEGTSFPPSATMCNKCNTKGTVLMDGCATCLNCGYSKCG